MSSPEVSYEDEGPQQLPWSKNALRRVGKALTSPEPWPDNAPPWEEVAVWYEQVKGYVQAVLYVTDWGTILGEGHEPSITARLKSDDTLREKLQREPRFPLPEVQDVAGVRFEADMQLRQQDEVVEEIGRIFDSLGWDCDVKDYRAEPGHGNYRAVHARLKRRSDGARVEIQIRTRLQGLWANVYERLADRLGRSIRYGEMPTKPEDREHVEEWQALSVDLIQRCEELHQEIRDAGSTEQDSEMNDLRAQLIDTLNRTVEHLNAQNHQL